MSQFESDLADEETDQQSFRDQLHARTQQSLCAPETQSAQPSCEQSALVAPSAAPANINKQMDDLLQSLTGLTEESENSLDRAPYLLLGYN